MKPRRSPGTRVEIFGRSNYQCSSFAARRGVEQREKDTPPASAFSVFRGSEFAPSQLELHLSHQHFPETSCSNCIPETGDDRNFTNFANSEFVTPIRNDLRRKFFHFFPKLSERPLNLPTEPFTHYQRCWSAK